MVLYRRGIFSAALLVASFTLALARPDLNAFLNRRVHTKTQLVNQVQTDSAVMDRYMRHFGITREEVVSYMQSLHAGTIDHDMVVKIYSVPDAGYIKTHVGRIRKGTEMFFTPDGEPALIALCGNPVTESRAPTAVTVNPTVAVTGELRPPTTENPNPEQSLALLQPKDIELPAMPPEDTGHDNLAVAPGISAAPLLGLLGVGGFGLFHNGGHGSGAPTPEPMTVLLVGSGLAAAYRAREYFR